MTNKLRILLGFLRQSLQRFSDTGYSVAFRDIDRVGALKKGWEGMIVWSDPVTEQQSQALRELATRLLAETIRKARRTHPAGGSDY